MLNFLVVYNRRTGEVSIQEFSADQDREAIRARFEAEAQHRGEPDIEVVVLNADSEDTLRRTHGRYFYTAAQLVAGAGL
jgi:spore cortex formation protein SpoVR/YcgB (stage V sporulation)